MLRENAPTLVSPTLLEFLLVSNNYKTLTAVTGGLKQFGASFGFVPTTDSAREYLGRRKMDGIIVDLQVHGALDLIQAIRKGSSNRYAAVFACLESAQESPAALAAGANFFLHQPLTAESVLSHVTAAQTMMAQERRRFFRHPVSLPVFLAAGGAQQRAMMVNVSEGGMAVRVAKPLKDAAIVDFAFEFSFGHAISGKGRIAWSNREGMAGIEFQLFRGKGKEHLLHWLTAWQSVSPPPLANHD